MQKVKLTPDEILTGAGTYRKVTEIDCPVCGEDVTVVTAGGVADCDGCGTEFGVENPFN